MKRLAAMQDWPLLMVRAFTAVLTASSRSALGITMNGSLPPSSSTVFLICRPAALATWRPAGSLPVRVAALDARIVEEPLDLIGGDQQRLEHTLQGSPRAGGSARSPGRTAAIEACFSSPTLPAISAGAAKRNTCQNGKFHGMMASTGPSGW